MTFRDLYKLETQPMTFLTCAIIVVQMWIFFLASLMWAAMS
jgi:hypothetical protein